MLAYRSTFRVSGTCEHAVRTVSRIMVEWSERKHHRSLGDSGLNQLTPGTLLEPRPGLEFIMADSIEQSGNRIFGFVVIEHDGPAAWTSQVMVAGHPEDGHGAPVVSVVVDAPPDDADPLRPKHAGVPRFVRRMLEDLDCQDFGIHLTSSPRLLGPEDVPALLKELGEEDHHGLVFVAGTPEGFPMEQWSAFIEKITGGTVGQGATYLLDVQATSAFNDRVSERHMVHGGSLRSFVPGARFDEPADGVRHRYLTADTLADDERCLSAAKVLTRRSRAFTNSRPLDRRTRRYLEVLGRRLDEIDLPRGEPLEPNALPPVEAVPVIPAEHAAVASVEPVPMVPVEPVASRGVAPGAVPAALGEAAPGVAGGAEGADPGEAGEVGPSEKALMSPEAVAGLRAEVESLRHVVSVRERSLVEARRKEQELQNQVAVLRRRGEQQAARFEELELDLETKTEEIAELSLDYAVALEDKDKALSQAEKANREIARLRGLLSGLGRGQDAWDVPEAEPDLTPPSGWPELVTWANSGDLAQMLPWVEFTCDWDRALDLDDQNDLAWIATTWDILRALNDYGRARADEAITVRTLHEYLREPPEGYRAVPLGRYKPSESETVSNSKRYRGERTFPVPEKVAGRDSTGRLFMEKHFVIAQAGMVSPRLYLHDATSERGYGKVVVGYIGRHLTNGKTN